jgi:hypothetical protein
MSELGVRLVAKLFNLVPDRLWQRLCEYGSGHRYITAVIHGDAGFVVDPTVGCSHCGKPMSPDVYVALTDAYAAALTLETDEVWD